MNSTHNTISTEDKKRRATKVAPTGQPSFAVNDMPNVQRDGTDLSRMRPSQVMSLQRSIGNQAVQRLVAPQRAPQNESHGPANQRTMTPVVQRASMPDNKTGLPDGLKSGIESLSGISMNDVKVHYNSKKPAEFGAAAYTQGTDIHVGAGQESTLGHEAWHTVQQKQGRVKSSVQFKGINANTDSSLEHEADKMGDQATKLANVESRLPSTAQSMQSSQMFGQASQTISRQITGSPVRQFASGGKKKKTKGVAPTGKKVTFAMDDLDDLSDEDEVIKYAQTKSVNAHYAGEDVDSSTNPMISDGRKGVAQQRGMGIPDAQIRENIKKILPAYSYDDIDTYFMDTSTAPKVKYVDSTDRADYALTVEGGKLKQRGATFDTGDMFSSGAGAGYSIFVMGQDGGIYANQHRPGLFHHSSFLAGMPSAAAGELKVEKGKLRMVTNKSGHYHPGAPQMFQAMQEFEARGLKLSSFGLKIAGIPQDSDDAKWNGEYPSAKQFYTAYAKA